MSPPRSLEPDPARPGRTSGPAAPRRVRGTERLLSLSVLGLAVLYGCARLAVWLVDGRFEGALVVTLALGGLLLALLAAGLLIHVPSFELALAGLAWAFCTTIVTELSPFAAARVIGSGPSHVPVYVALAFASGVFALGLPRGVWPSDPAARAALLLALWSTAGGRVFERGGDTAIPMLAAGTLLVLGTRARFRVRDLLSGPGYLLVAAIVAMVGWWTAATIAGDHWRSGVAALTHLVGGVLLAWALATSLDRRGARAAWAGLAAGVLTVLVLLAAAVVEMLPYNEPIRIFGSRLSLFGRHPNQVAPIFVVGACLFAPLALRGRDPNGTADGRHRLPRVATAIPVALCLVALGWTQSRGGLLAAATGLVAALFATRGWLPRRPLAAWTALFATLLVAAAAVASPLGAGLRARLAEQTEAQSAVGQRYHIWRSAGAAVAEHPWLGVGPAQYYVHARFAEPSYYDGTYQDVHPHSLFFAAAESAGLPGLALVVALVVGLLELGRRRVLAVPPGPERRVRAGLFAACVGLVAANTVDFQGGASLVPPFLWVALGIFAVQGRPAEAPAGRAPAAGALATWLALVPLAVMPLAGPLAVDWARHQPDWTALRVYELLRFVHPWNGQAVSEEIAARTRLGQRREALAMIRTEAEGSPGRLGAQVRYGLLLLELGRVEEALARLEYAQELDPLGSRAGMTAMALARAHQVAGDEEVFRETALGALTLPAGELGVLLSETLPPEPGDPEDAVRLSFPLGSEAGDARSIPASELLDELGRRALELIEEDEVNARRLLGRVVEAYLEMGLTNEALKHIDRYTERAPPMFSMTAKKIDLLCKLGDYRGASEVFDACPDRAHPYMTVYYLRGIGNSDDPELQRRFRELPIAFKASRDSDLYFTAEQSAPVFEAQAERALVLGQLDAALGALERALYHYSSPPARFTAAERFLRRTAHLGRSNGELLRAFEVFLREANLHRSVLASAPRTDEWARLLRSTWDGPIEPFDMPFEVELALRRAGPAGRALGAAWNRTEPTEVEPVGAGD